MNTSQNIKTLKERVEKTTYTGTFKDFQAFGSSFKGERYADYEKSPYNELQNFLYKRALFGLKIYSDQNAKELHWQKRQRIQKVHKRAQKELNIWKQEKMISITNKVFDIFRRSSFAKEVIDIYSDPDPKFISKASFKELSLSKEDVINRLLSRGILPKNFKTL
jgi:hypothetical protein